MNKYELALVVSAKIEDDARTATVEKAKEYITRAGGTVTEVEDWGKKKLAYEVQKMKEAFYYFIKFEAENSVSVVTGTSRQQILSTALHLAELQSFWRDSDVRELNSFWRDVFRPEATPTRTDSVYTRRTLLLRM